MNRKKDTAYGINRLESKNARAAIIQKISADFNLMPLVAEAYSEGELQCLFGRISSSQSLASHTVHHFTAHTKTDFHLLCATRRRSTDIGTNLLRGSRCGGTGRQTHRFSEKSLLSTNPQ